MNEHGICAECGSHSPVASGVLEHGTWIQRLTCWTCKDCRSIVIMPDDHSSPIDDLTSDPA